MCLCNNINNNNNNNNNNNDNNNNNITWVNVVGYAVAQLELIKCPRWSALRK